MNAIDSGEIKFSPTVRLLDPNGRVFFYKGGVYRAIYKHRVEFVRKLFDDGIVDALVRKNLLVGTYLTDMELEGFGLVLRHDAIDVNIKSAEWSIVTYIEAAKQYLRLVKELFKYNLILIDGHHGNFSLSFDGIPLWHDFGSIGEHPGGTFFTNSLAEFREYFYYPLMYYRMVGSFSLIRRLGLHLANEDYMKMLLSRYRRFRERFHFFPLGVRPFTRFLFLVSRRLGGSSVSDRINNRLFSRLVNVLYSDIDHISYEPEKTVWSDYHDKISFKNIDDYGNPRSEAIITLIKKISPDRILDLGSNQGVFSHLAYRYCPVVIASDYDHAAVAKHAKFLLDSKAGRKIFPVVIDVIKMNDGAKSRYRSHTVLALALTHHLRLGQQYPFDYIAKQFSDLAERFLVTEFMPNGLGTGKVSPDPLPDDYTLDSLLFSLREYFNTVTVVDYAKDPKVSPRILVLCEK